jgi:hypothetical protein
MNCKLENRRDPTGIFQGEKQLNNNFHSFEFTLTIMKRVTLLFPDTKSLWAFAQTLQGDDVQINSTEKKLTCYCSDGEISKALTQYRAQIVDEVEERRM